ncbi:Tryptophan aminotransferase-related protein [Drosera capensis]
MEFGFEMTKIRSNKFLTLCLRCSIIVKVYLLSLDKLDHEESWSRSAAQEAEAVVLISCSGHGSAFLDGPVVDGKPVCEYYACYTGPDCSILSPDGCVADADSLLAHYAHSRNPFFLEPFWKQRAASSAMVAAGWHRMSYAFDDGRVISSELEKLILRIHAIIGNALTQDKYIVFGSGSTQLLNASVHALSASNSTFSVARVVASIPFYPVYQIQTDCFRPDKYRFEGDAASFKNNISDSAEYYR